MSDWENELDDVLEDKKPTGPKKFDDEDEVDSEEEERKKKELKKKEEADRKANARVKDKKVDIDAKWKEKQS